LGLVLRGVGVCTGGYAAAHVLVLWFDVLVHYTRECLYKRDTDLHAARNAEFQVQTAATSAPRVVIRRTHAWGVLVLAVVGGISDGLSVVLSPSRGADSYALASLAVFIGGRHTRWCSGIALLYIMLTAPVPGVHGVMRALCLLLSTVLYHARLSPSWCLLRITVGTAIVYMTGVACAVRGVPPTLLLSVALHRARASPAIVLTLAALVSV